MYDENYLNKALKAANASLWLMLVPAALLLGGAIWSFVIRIKWLTILLSALAGCWMVFTHQNIVIPRRSYAEHVRSALRVAHKETCGHYLRMEETPVERENVMFYAFYLNVGEKQDPEDDRLFYYDALKPMPGWKSGDMLKITSYDKYVSSYEVSAGAASPAPAL